MGSLPMRGALDLVQDMSALVAESEIVVLWANPVDSGVPRAEYCVNEDEYQDPGVLTEEDWQPFEDLTGEVLDTIWEARDGRPTVIRVTDLYVPILGDWEEHGIRDACMAVFKGMSAAVRSAAEVHGAVFVSSLDLYNGLDHTQDPVAAGLIDRDGIHPSEAGGQAVAGALAATGFEPAPAP